MRFLLLVLLGSWPLIIMAQRVETKSLGYLEGETKRTQFQIERDSQDYLELKLSSDKAYVNIERNKLGKSDSLIKWDVLIQFDGRIGRYSDTLLFYTNEELVTEVLIVDYQILKPVDDVFKSFDNEFWPFRSQEQVFNLKTGRRGDTLTSTFDLYNFSGKTLELEDVYMSDSIQATFDPQQVEHHSFTRLKLSYFTNDSTGLGFERSLVPLLIDDDTLAYLPIQYSVIPSRDIMENRVEVNRSSFDFKVVKQGEIKTEVTFITNNGEEPLIVSKIETNCDCLMTELSNYTIRPGDNAQLKVIFDSTDRSGLEQKTVSVFFENAHQPVVNFTFKAHVKK